VGGGEVLNTVKTSLANVTLRWMVGEVMKTQCGVIFDTAALQRQSIPTVTLPGGTESENIPEVVQLDELDALEPVHDQLKKNVLWWILEIIPSTYTWQDVNGVWHRDFGFNFGRGRKIEDQQPNFHETVKLRMQDKNLKYKPSARYTPGKEKYIR
jgi:hypothetical protein